jgi:CheY-like chemotaxis protein
MDMLVVDDRAIRTSLERALRLEGFDVRLADDGDVALDACRGRAARGERSDLDAGLEETFEDAQRFFDGQLYPDGKPKEAYRRDSSDTVWQATLRGRVVPHTGPLVDPLPQPTTEARLRRVRAGAARRGVRLRGGRAGPALAHLRERVVPRARELWSPDTSRSRGRRPRSTPASPGSARS